MGSPNERFYETVPKMTEEDACRLMLMAGAVSLRDVDNGEEPFLYSSGNYGPGYVMVKGLVGEQTIFKPLVAQLALRLAENEVEFDNIAGNATGGMIPAYQCREDYQRITGKKEVGYAYVRGTRKEGGHKELITGINHLEPVREDGSPPHWLVVEELVNFGETTTNSLNLLRNLGFVANQGATILHYDHDTVNRRLTDNGIHLTYLATLPNLLNVGVEYEYFSEDAVSSYREFLADPAGWQATRGITPKELA